MRKEEYVKVSSIIMDSYPLNPSTLYLIDYLRSGGDIPPIKLAKNTRGQFVIRDGRHRVLACKMLGLKEIKARYHTKNMIKW